MAGDSIAMGTNTDPYQRCEGKYRLTHGLVEVLGAAGNPFSILTKSALILGDLDLLTAAAERTTVHAALSIGTLDEAVRQLNGAGYPLRGTGRAGAARAIRLGRPARGGRHRLRRGGRPVDLGDPLKLRPGVRASTSSAGCGARDPDVAADYEQRYRRAYLLEAEQKALSAPVKAIAERAWARHGPSSAHRAT
jgi:hypothetical protein